MPDETPPAVSPTGQSLFPKLPPWATGLLMLATAAAGYVTLTPADFPPVVLPWAKLLFMLGTVGGWASPGLRK